MRNNDERPRGPATVLAIGTALPVNCFRQADFPDFYFRATKSEHLTQLKEKFKRICKFLICCKNGIRCINVEFYIRILFCLQTYA